MVDPEVIKKIQKLSKQGESLSSIAKQFGLSWLTVRKYAAGEENSRQDKTHERDASKRVILNRPSQKVIDQREDVEIVGLEVEKQKSLKELEKVTGSKEHPALTEKRARVEVAKLDLDEYQAQKQLEKLKKEEEEKVQSEEEARFEREMERQVFAEEQERERQHLKWVEGLKEWALTWALDTSKGISLPADLKFKIKDTVGKVLMDRSEQESKMDIEELIKITTQSVLQPFLDKVKAEKKTRLIQSALPKVEDYIKAQGLEGYLNEESKGKIREDVKNHFMKVLSGKEAVIWPNEVFDLLNIFLKPIKEKAREAREEKIKKEREEREAKEKAFWEKVKEKREREEEEQKKERMEELVKNGINYLYTYLAINRKDLKTVNFQEQQRARRYLEGELKREVKGAETNEEVRKITDEILNNFFFEEG